MENPGHEILQVCHDGGDFISCYFCHVRCLATWSNDTRSKPYSYVGVWEIKTKVYKGRSRYPGVRLTLKPTIISCAVEMCHTVTVTKLLVKTEWCIADSGRALISCTSEQRHAVLIVAH